MLKEANEGDRAEILRFCEKGIIAAYLGCRLQCYGFVYPFVRFWVGRTDGRLNAVICSLDGNAVLAADETADPEELRAFLHMIGFSSLMLDAALAARLGLNGGTQKQAYRYAREMRTAPSAQSETDMKALYALISEAIPGAFSQGQEAYLSFLSDYMFRYHREMARLGAVEENGLLCACALTAAETKNAAVISGVSCRADLRGKGYGKRVVLFLAETLRSLKKVVYVIALNPAAQGFYEAIGFEKSEQIQLLEQKDYV